jgi:adenylyltransferase/sulfurtransferase
MDVLASTNSRYHRQELITWWDQEKLRAARVLVVGAGALGNEVVKNLALVGVGCVDVVDMDTIEHSNLSRCVFFREEDEGKLKSDVLVSRALTMNPELTAEAMGVPVQRLGIGFLASYDLVIGALDNREARAWVNQAVRKLGGFWIDGAIEGLRGIARMFGPDGPCYACTLTEADWLQMSHRKSCALLAPEEILDGKTPTNATTASIVAGVQVQEAIKFLVGRHDLLSLVGRCWTYTGDLTESYTVSYREDEWCSAHDRYLEVQPSTASTAAELVASVSGLVEAVDFEEDLITLEPCSECGGVSETSTRSGLPNGAGVCAHCGTSRLGEQSTSLLPGDPRLVESFTQLGLAASDVVTLRTGEARRHFVIEGRADV